MIPRPPRSTLDRSSAASDVYKRQLLYCRAAYYFLTDSRENALATLQEALSENTKEHDVLLKLIPEIMDDREVMSMIRYFSVENE